MSERGAVRLRPVAEDDLPILFEHQHDPEGARMADFASRDRDAFMEHWHGILRNDGVLARTILVDGEVAGNVTSFEFSGLREVGYWIGREHWGKGIATSALSLFLQEERHRPLYAGVAAGNAGSLRVLEKCGFRPDDREDPQPGHVLFRLDD